MSRNARLRALVVVDGEHYPPVVRAALERVRDRYEIAGGLFAGGREKLRAVDAGAPGLAAELGLPSIAPVDPRAGDPAAVAATVAVAVRAVRADIVVDLSDEPVLGYRERLLLVSAALAAGAAYRGADFSFEPPPRLPVHALPSINVIGTGKRVGKTAVAGHLARLLDGRLRREGGVVVVAMGRGGPSEPEIVPGRDALDAADLLAASRDGRHAASDCFEDAVFARVPTVGCRRCGGGMAGAAFDSNVARRAAARRAVRGGARGVRGQRSGGSAGGRRRDALRRRGGPAARVHHRLPRHLPPAHVGSRRPHHVRAAVRGR